MITIIVTLGFIGFFVSLAIMYGTNHGIPGIQKYSPGFRLLDMRFRYNGDSIYQAFNELGIEGMTAYKSFLCLDFCFITCFLVVMLFISYKLVPTRNYMTYTLMGLAVIRALLDVLENILLLILIHTYPVQHQVLGEICSWATTFKFVALFAWLICVGIVIISKLF